jgi:hypothetical protein
MVHTENAAGRGGGRLLPVTTAHRTAAFLRTPQQDAAARKLATRTALAW